MITGSLNPALSNSPWTVKRPEILKFSKLNLTRYFHDVDAWDETAIIARGTALLEVARKVWPHPGRVLAEAAA